MIHISRKAFTLVELMIYIAMTAAIITFVASFAFNLSNGISTVHNRGDEQKEILFVIERITREIENSQGVNISASVFGVNPSRLALIQDGGINTIELAPDSAIQMRYSNGNKYVLSTPSIKITSLIFTNESKPKRPGIIHLKITSSAFDEPFETAVSYRELIEVPR